MLKDTLQQAINKQINEETYSAYLYYSMSAFFESRDLKGMANWMRIQAQEELFHVNKFFTYVHDREGRISLQPVAGPPLEWANPLEVFKAAHDHECKISRLINDLVDLSMKESDHATANFLQWFVGEQVEEEASAAEIVGQLKLVGDSGYALLMLDRELGQRVFTPPAEGEA